MNVLNVKLSPDGFITGDNLEHTLYVYNEAHFKTKEQASAMTNNLVMDTSSSTIMQFPFGSAAMKPELECARKLLPILGKENKITIWAYGSEAKEILPLTLLKEISIEKVLKQLEEAFQGGSTNPLKFWEKKINEKIASNSIEEIDFFGDGKLDTEVKDKVISIAKKCAERGYKIKAFGIGKGADMATMEKIAQEAYYIEDPEQLPALFTDQISENINIVGKKAEIILELTKQSHAQILSSFVLLPQIRNSEQKELIEFPAPSGLIAAITKIAIAPAKKEGTFKIGKVTLKLDGELIESKDLVIRFCSDGKDICRDKQVFCNNILVEISQYRDQMLEKEQNQKYQEAVAIANLILKKTLVIESNNNILSSDLLQKSQNIRTLTQNALQMWEQERKIGEDLTNRLVFETTRTQI